jgi:proteasome assembly chaperone (PAC2) family protein
MWMSFDRLGELKPRNPTLIVAVSTSMPQYKALYSQARELGEYMLRKMGFEKVGTIRSSAFPPEVVVRDDGRASLPECSFYLSKTGRDLMLFAGDTSPMEEQYAFAKALLEKSKEFGVKELYSVGARWAENPLSPETDPEPSGFATDKVGVGKLKKHGVKVLNEEPAPFFASMVVAMAKGYGIRGYKLSVDHGEPSPHVRSVVRLLDLLSRMAGFEVDLEELKAQVKPSFPPRKSEGTAIYQ